MFVGNNGLRIAQEEDLRPCLHRGALLGHGRRRHPSWPTTRSMGWGGGWKPRATARAFNVARRIRAGTVIAQGVGGTDVTERRARVTARAQGWGTDMAGIGQNGCLRWIQTEWDGSRVGPPRPSKITEIKSITWM